MTSKSMEGRTSSNIRRANSDCRSMVRLMVYFLLKMPHTRFLRVSSISSVNPLAPRMSTAQMSPNALKWRAWCNTELKIFSLGTRSTMGSVDTNSDTRMRVATDGGAIS